jgi:hypothetical protein
MLETDKQAMAAATSSARTGLAHMCFLLDSAAVS